MLSSLLLEKIKNENLRFRQAAKQIRTSHTTLIRAIRGETVDLGTVILCSAWLDVRPTELLDSMSTADHALADQIAVVLARNPKLAEAFQRVINQVINGSAGPDVVADIARYAAYRINVANSEPEGEHTRD